VQTNWKKWHETGSGEVKTFWKKGKLVVERRGEDDRKITARYSINSDGRLVVTTTFNMGRLGPVTFDRLYDRAPEEKLPEEW